MQKYFPYVASILILIVYISTAAPDVMFTDSGELAAVCATLGIAHPTGYPLFTILGYLWTHLPIPVSTIYSLNLFAAFLTAASAFVFYFLILNFLKLLAENTGISKKARSTDNGFPDYVALICTLMYGFALTVWEQAVAIEVYSLHILLINTTLTVLIYAIRQKTDARLFLATAFMLGLSLSNHLTSVLIIPAILFLFFKNPSTSFDFSKPKLRLFALLFLPLFLGLSLYLYLPLRSAGAPDFDWGGVSRGLDKFLYHVQGKQYQVWMFSGTDVWGDNFKVFFSSLPYQFAFVGLLFTLAGIYFTYRINSTLGNFISLIVLTCVFYAINYSIHDIDSYFLAAFIGLFIFTAVGLNEFLKRYGKYKYGLLLLPLSLIVLNYNSNNLSNNYLTAEYTRITVDNLEPNAIIISAQWDYWNSAFWYKQKVEGYREDVALIEKELLRRTWYPIQLERWHPEITDLCSKQIDDYQQVLEVFESTGFFEYQVIQTRFESMMNCFIDQNYGKRPIYITFDILQTEQNIARDYDKIPVGFAFKLTKDPMEIVEIDFEKLDISKFYSSARNRKGHLTEGILNTAAINLLNIARYAHANGDAVSARKAIEKSLILDPQNFAAQQLLNQLRN